MTNWDEIGKENQLKYEGRINQWDNSMMHYREGPCAHTRLYWFSENYD